MTIKISGLGNLTAVYGNTIIPVVANIAGTLTTVKGNLDQFGTYINRAELPYGNIIPFADAVYSLGTPSYRFKDLYLLGTTIFLGNANISVSNAAVTTSLPFTAATVNATNLNVGANVSANNISVSGEITATDVTTTGTVSAGDITSSGTVQAANISATVTLSAANLSVSGDLSVSNLEVSGNTITLGSATLNVAGGTLQSSVPIEAAITSTSNLTVQGARIEFAQGAYVVEEEVAGSPGQYALTLTSAEDGIVGLNALDTNAIVSSSVIVSNVSVQLNVANVDPGVGNVNVWLYDSIGGLFFPDGTRQDTAYDVSVNYSNAKVAAYLTSQNIASYSNVQVATYLTGYSGYIGANVQVGGAITYVYNPLSVVLPPAINYANTVLAGTNNADGYVQLNIQNINTVGNLVSADFIATAPNGTDTSHYIDVGINGNNYSSAGWTISSANDGYVYINQGNLTLGTDTASKTVKIHTGGTLAANVITTFASNGVSVHGNLYISNVYVPPLANSPGTTGQVTYDSNYVYVCLQNNVWRRANLVAW